MWLIFYILFSSIGLYNLVYWVLCCCLLFVGILSASLLRLGALSACCTGIGQSAVTGLLRDELVGAMYDWSNVGSFVSR